MPGVNVTTAVRSGPVGTGDIVAGQLFVVGETERGPIDAPMLLRSFSDYTTYYGKYQSGNLYAHVKTYFDEGGTRCYVQRVVGAGSAPGEVSFSASPSGATIDFTAANDGEWADNLEIEIAAADVSGFKVKVYLDDVLLLTTRDLSSVDDAVSVINSSIVSHLVVASDNATASGNPAVAAKTALSGGDNGATVTSSEIAAALDAETTALSPNLKNGAVAAPGWYGATVWNALRDHAAAFNRIALCAFSPSAASGSAKSDASDYYTDEKASYMGFYWPAVKVSAPSITELATGATLPTSSVITISPEAFVAGARSRAVQQASGPWRAGAGQISASRTLRGLATEITPAGSDLMDEARVNVIRKIGNSIRVYGARSVSSDEANWRYITMRDTMNHITVGIEERMEEYVFETIDGRGALFGKIRGSIKAFLEPIRIAGGLYEAFDDTGAQIDPGYNVIVDSSINPVTQLATGLVKAQVGVRVSGVADLIDIVITKSNLSAPII